MKITLEQFESGDITMEQLKQIAAGELRVERPAENPSQDWTGPTIARKDFETGQVTMQQLQDIADGKLRIVDRPSLTIRELLARGQE